MESPTLTIARTKAATPMDNFNLTHSETDYLLTYPDENSFNAEQESQFLKEKAESEREIELIAIVDGVQAYCDHAS